MGKMKRPYTGPPIRVKLNVWNPAIMPVYDTVMEKEGKFSFTSDKGGNYRFCLDYTQMRRIPQTNKIKVSWKLNIGDNAEDQNQDGLAKKEQLTNLQILSGKMKRQAKDFVKTQELNRDREDELSMVRVLS